MKVSGVVVKGKQKGSAQGFPTANIRPGGKFEPGVYVGKVFVLAQTYRAAIFIPESGELIEANILDFSGDLYGQTIEIEIGKKLRNPMKFKEHSELLKQIKSDIDEVRRS